MIEGLSIRLYLDHNIDPRLAFDLRRRGFDVIYAREIGMERATDEEHLRWAAEHGRVILTYDRGDFSRLASQWSERGAEHPGVIVAIAPPRMSYGELLRRLLRFLDAVTADEMVNQVRWLPPA